jgi:hypothetical protein
MALVYIVQHREGKVAAASPEPQIKINLTENAKSDILAMNLAKLPAVAVLVSERQFGGAFIRQ